MSQPLYIVNAFTQSAFGGNPAAVMPLQEWLPDEVMQAIAAQHNLSETAFVVPEGEGWALRWFTPRREVDLCGHATLATAYVLREFLGVAGRLRFATRSGVLTVVGLADGQLEMDFPAVSLERVAPEAAVMSALGCEVLDVMRPVENPWQWLYRVADADTLIELSPDFAALAAAADHGVIVTAPGEEYDFVSRFFIPRLGIDEDPVTGSAHCLLTPYWVRRLEKDTLRAKQLSNRGGEINCTLAGSRVLMSGHAVAYARAEILPSIF